MKEQKLLEMANKLNTLANVCDRLIKEIDLLKTLAFGDHALIMKMPGFQEALKELQIENEAGNDPAPKLETFDDE